MADQAGGILPDIERNEETRLLLAELARLIRERKRTPLAAPLGQPREVAQNWLECMGDFTEEEQEAERTLLYHAAKLVERIWYLSMMDLIYYPDDPEADQMRGEAMRLLSLLKKNHTAVWGLKRGCAPCPTKPACLRTWAALPEDKRKGRPAKKRFAQHWIRQTPTGADERTITNWLAQWEKERQS